MNVEKFKINGEFIFTGGNSYDSVKSLLQEGFLGFCGCGNAKANLLYILGGLELINTKFDKKKDTWGAWYAEHSKKESKYFGSIGAKYFFYYWADKEELTEHGGGVPGWLTPKGVEFLEMLREYRDMCNGGE